MKEDLVESGEYFPKGGFGYLERLCEHAASLGIYVIIGQFCTLFERKLGKQRVSVLIR